MVMRSPRDVTASHVLVYIQHTGKTASDTEAAPNNPNVCETITTVVHVYFRQSST